VPEHFAHYLRMGTLHQEQRREGVGNVEIDSSSEAEAVRAALEDPTSPPDVTHGLRVRINEVVETKEY
jgi:hypothetical protein